MKLFSTILLLAATADARRNKKNKTAEVEESSGEGSGVAPVTGEEAVTTVTDLVDGIVDAGRASGERLEALDKRLNILKDRKSKLSPLSTLTKSFRSCPYHPRRRMHDSLQR